LPRLRASNVQIESRAGSAGQASICFAFLAAPASQDSIIDLPRSAHFVELLIVMVALEDGQGLLSSFLFGVQDGNIALLRTLVFRPKSPPTPPLSAVTGSLSVPEAPTTQADAQRTSSTRGQIGTAIRETRSQAALQQMLLDAYVARDTAAAALATSMAGQSESRDEAANETLRTRRCPQGLIDD